MSFVWTRLVLTSPTYHAISLSLSLQKDDSMTSQLNATFHKTKPDEDKAFSGSLVLDLGIWWRHVHKR